MILLEWLDGFISVVWTFFEQYGWYLLIAGIFVTYIYQSRLKSKLIRYKSAKDEAEYAAKYHKNPDLLAARLNAQQSYAEKLQEQYKRDAEEYQRKQEEKQARKREELLDKFKDEGGRRLGTANDDDNAPPKKSKSFKPEYNPLMGGNSSNYRPPRRSTCGGGGCG